jgi:hypothetical protein
MEITNLGVNNPPLKAQPQVAAADLSSGAQTAPNITANSSTYTPSPELQRLLDQVRIQPAVREDRVQAAAERLKQGFYHSQSSIEQTAEAMMHAGD